MTPGRLLTMAIAAYVAIALVAGSSIDSGTAAHTAVMWLMNVCVVTAVAALVWWPFHRRQRRRRDWEAIVAASREQGPGEPLSRWVVQGVEPADGPLPRGALPGHGDVLKVHEVDGSRVARVRIERDHKELSAAPPPGTLVTLDQHPDGIYEVYPAPEDPDEEFLPLEDHWTILGEMVEEFDASELPTPEDVDAASPPSPDDPPVWPTA